MDGAAKALRSWLWWASHSCIPAICDLARKVRQRQQHILNAIRFKMSNAKIEATNNKIKLIIRKAYGFRNIDNKREYNVLGQRNVDWWYKSI